FLTRGCCGVARVDGSLLRGLRFGLQVTDLRAAVEEQKAKFLSAEQFALAEPRVLLCSWRRAKPVAGERKGFAEDGERGVAGIRVEIEAEVGARCGILSARADWKGRAGKHEAEHGRKSGAEGYWLGFETTHGLNVPHAG